MMKKVSLFLIVLMCLWSQAQNYKVIYQVNWKPSVEKDSMMTDLAVLAINNRYSYFTGYDNFRNDSLKSKIVTEFFNGNGQGNLRFPDPAKLSRFNKTIIKNIASDSTIQEEKYHVSTFQIVSTCKLKWKMEKETKTILGFVCKKASLDFGGRKWTAWYSESIPISDGPYKFHGLPGLILSINDEKKEYSFEIKGITKEINDVGYRNFGMPNPVKLSPSKWETFYARYKDQPSVIFENLNTEHTTYVINGKDIDRNEKIAYNLKEKKYLLENNNMIELISDCKK